MRVGMLTPDRPRARRRFAAEVTMRSRTASLWPSGYRMMVIIQSTAKGVKMVSPSSVRLERHSTTIICLLVCRLSFNLPDALSGCADGGHRPIPAASDAAQGWVGARCRRSVERAQKLGIQLKPAGQLHTLAKPLP